MQKEANNNLEQALDLIAHSEVDFSNMFKQNGILPILRTLLTRFGKLPSINMVKYRFQIQ